MATLDQLKSVDIPGGFQVPVELRDYFITKATTFFSGADLPSLTPANWAYFAASVATLYVKYVEDTSVTKTAVDQMLVQMADNKTEELVATRQAAFETMLLALQTFQADPNLGEIDKKDIPGVLRAIEIIRRSA